MAIGGLEVLFGAAALAGGRMENEFSDEANVARALQILKEHGINKIDTAQIYGQSEATLGRFRAGTDAGFTIDTKWVGGWTGQPWASKENIRKSTKDSLQKLGVTQIDVFYMHSPDTKTSTEETLRAIDSVYREGGFRRFGLSNYSPAQIREVLDIAKRNGFVKPSVYQGNYSAVARMAEEELIPLLRQEGIAFYAYSPIAGGLLTKAREFVEGRQGRFCPGYMNGIYYKMYTKASFLDVLDEWNDIASDESISKAALAYRWIYFHSALKPHYGDGIVIGASGPNQLEQTVQALLAGPLSDGAANRVDALWEKVRDDSIPDNFRACFPEL